MSSKPDPIAVPQPPDRVHYALGTLLGVDDFVAEQSYHRGRLARALRGLHHGGTLLGLRAERVAADPANNVEEEIRIQPGLALDRLGRLIEVPRLWCLRLDRWYNAQRAAAVKAAFRDSFDTPEGEVNNVVVCDLFIRFDNCERGRTPSFASTTFDGLNATSPSRQRDFFHIDLYPRRTPSAPTPAWPGIALGATRDAIHTAILSAPLDADFTDNAWKPLPEHEPGIPPESVLLARVLIPATDASPKPTRRAGDFQPDNRLRRFVYPPCLLAQLVLP